MQAVVFPSPETVVVEQVSDPACGPDEVIVQVARSGICGTDLHIYRNEYISDFPLVPGHEFGGVIVEVGQAVSTFSWLANGVVDVTPLISHTLPLTDFLVAFQDFAAGHTLKVHLQLDIH